MEKKLIEAKDENSNLLREGETIYFNALKKKRSVPGFKSIFSSQSKLQFDTYVC